MGLFSIAKSVYELDTLDTRFTSEPTVPYQTVIDARNDPVLSREARSKAQSQAPPSKWKTPEFYFYYMVIIIALPCMFWVAYDVSRRASMANVSLLDIRI